MENDSMELRFVTTSDDMIYGFFIYDSKNALSAKNQAKQALMGLLSGAILLLIAYNFLFLIAFPFGVVVANFICYRLLRKRQVKTLCSMPGYGEPDTITLSDQGIHMVTATSDLNLKWAQFRELIETQRSYLIMSKAFGFVQFPKRVFSDAEQMGCFRKIVEKNLAVEANSQ